jgi:excinuclease UvrABC nuclease subunit
MLEELFDDCLQIDPASQTAEDLKPLPACKGVLLFADNTLKPIQLLTAANIRRTAAHRLFPQDLPVIKRRADISRIVSRIYCCRCYNDFGSALKHYQIAKALYPGTYSEQLTLPRQSYVKINAAAKWPFFSLADKPAGLGGQNVFGPFPSRKAATEFVKILQDAFGLCKRPDLLAAGQNFASCPYLQMASCCAPCVGKIGRDEYLRYIADAISAAAGNAQKQTAKLKDQMQELAGRRAFEQAQLVKKRLDRLKLLGRSDYQWTGKLGDLAILHIDRSAKIASAGKRKMTRTYAAFLITAGCIRQLGDFTLEKIGEFHKSFLAQLAGPANRTDPKQTAEKLALLAYHLYRSKPRGIWINCSNQNRTPTTDEITNAISEKFDTKAKS